MTTHQLIKAIFSTLRRFKILVLAGGLILGLLFFFYARSIKPVYTSRATVFPLTSSSDNSGSTQALTSLLGISESPKSFSQEASINIVELALSRNTREAIASKILPELGPRTVAEILIENHNNSKSLFASAIKIPADQATLFAIGGDLLKSGIAAKINKNGILELNYSNTNKDLVSPISYQLIETISEYYKYLKLKKAKLDFDFTVRKIDSLDGVLDSFDRKAIALSNKTMFVPSERIEYYIPKENLSNQKEWVLRQRDASAGNREEALWRLQKQTPIIATLDKPDPPFTVKKNSTALYSGIGFILGCILTAFLIISGLMYRYAKSELHNMINGSGSDTDSKKA